MVLKAAIIVHGLSRLYLYCIAMSLYLCDFSRRVIMIPIPAEQEGINPINLRLPRYIATGYPVRCPTPIHTTEQALGRWLSSVLWLLHLQDAL